LAIFILSLVIALLIFFRAWWQRYLTAWVLTNIRLVDICQIGFFRRETSEIIYSSIKETYAQKRGFVNAISGTGDLLLEVKDSKAKFRLPAVRGYERAISEIILQIENYHQSADSNGSRQAQAILVKIKNKLGERAFNKLIGD
jgi:hypothetical protein